MSDLDGHELVSKGAPYNAAGKRVALRDAVFGHGLVVCSCGAQSPAIASATKRRQWHLDHKNAARTRSMRGVL